MLFTLLWLMGIAHAIMLPKFKISLPQTDGLTFEEECHIDYRAFDGVRLMEIRRLDFPSLSPLGKDIILLGCNKGIPEFSLKLDPGDVFDTNIMFNDNSNVTDRIRLSRRRVYAKYSNQKLRYIRDTVVGGVYLFSKSEITNELAINGSEAQPSWRPLSPLVSDSWTRTYQHYGFDGNMVKLSMIMSLLRSPDVLEKTYSRNDGWTKFVPVFNNYND